MITKKYFFLLTLTILLAALGVQAKGLKPTGELTTARGTTINNSAANSGTTIFSNARVKTATNGTAIINLGRLGRVELGPNSDLTLQFSVGIIGGSLASGKLVISSTTGVQVNFATPDGAVTSTDMQSARFVIDTQNGRTNVIASRGTAKLTSAGKVSLISVRNFAGEAITTAQPQSTAAKTKDANLANLLRASTNQALESAVRDRANKQNGGLFYSSITCKDFFDNPKCVRRSQKR